MTRLRRTGMEQLTWLKPSQVLFVFGCDAVDPARDSETDGQHVPDDRQEGKETR